jgi:lipoprotein-anchoring transpeptidase ErfK/SrfK
MYKDSTSARILAITLITALFIVSAASAWALTDDVLRRQHMPTGAAIDGNPVGGLSRADALAVVEEKVKGPLLAPATVTFQGKSFTLDPATYATVDVEGMLDAAQAPRVDAPLYERVLARVSGAPVGVAVDRKMKVDEAKLTTWLAEINPQVTVAAVNASMSVTTGMLRIIPAVPGATLDTATAPAAVSKALIDGVKNVALPSRAIEPKLVVAKLGKTIFVKLKTRRLYLYNGDKLEKEYGIAIGLPAFPTPKGWYTIINKRKYPSWSNPGSAWAAGMPASIGPGPSNPLGTRALDLDSPGIRIHGTSKDYSIGTAASHGCMRMHRKDVEELFELVPVGTKVIILS